MAINKNMIYSLAEKYGTPYYIAYPDKFIQNITSFKNALLKYYDKSILSYSFKTNYAPFVLKNILHNKDFAEVVSNMEYELALNLGFRGDNIIFNGPIKKEEDLYRAIINKSIIHIDSEYEVYSILNILKKFNLKDVRIGLRINMEINTRHGNSAIQGGLKESRFGLTHDMLERIIPILRSNHIKINSLHGHTSSVNRVVENYQIIAKRLLNICENFNLNDIEYFDVGGGFFGAAPDGVNVSQKPTYDDYAFAIISVLKNNKWFMLHKPTLIIEPGASVVSNVLDLVTSIYQHKFINQKNFIVLDASIYQVRPINGKVNYPFECYSNNAEQEEIVADLVGSTCMEVDVIAKDVKINHYKKDDVVLIKGVGAYRINLTSNFINYQAPIIAVYNNGDKELIRPNQNIEQVKQIYNL